SFNSGSTWSITNAVSNTGTPALYQTCRYGYSFAYQFAAPNGAYTVNLKFAEVTSSQPGQRVFNVAINGTPVLTNFDIAANAGGMLIALDKPFPVNVTNGQITIQFTAGPANAPMINAIEILQGGSSTPPPPAAGFIPIRINAGGPAYTDSLGQMWSADTDFN